jgi:uncharacterized membrane protein
MLSYASAQIGPRVVASLLRDRGSQVVLGTFIATFIYCLVVLRTIRAADEGIDSAAFVPHVAVLAGVLLALLSVTVLIYFIHHVPMLLDVPTVVSMLGRQLLAQARDAFPETGAKAEPCTQRVRRDAPTQTVRLTGDGGYLRVVEYRTLQAVAERVDRTLEALVVPGEFCVRGTPLVDVHGGTIDDDCTREIRSSFSWGGQRTPDQDILFLVEQLAEIAGKALSKGINDQFTAFLCIDQVERVVADIGSRCEAERVRPSHGKPRLIRKSVARQDLADRFLLPLRQFSLGDLTATERLLEMLARSIDRLDASDPLRASLIAHYLAVREDARSALEAASHRARIDALCASHRALIPPPRARVT